MKPLLLLSLAALLSACSTTPSSSDFPLDSLLHFKSLQIMKATLKDSAVEGSGYGFHVLFKGTSREVTVIWYSESSPAHGVDVDVEASGFQASTREDLPVQWKTRAGLYAGMSLDTLQALNGKPFYLEMKDKEIIVASWDEGALAQLNTNFVFAIDSGEVQSKMWSQYFVEKKINVRTTRMSLLERSYLSKNGRLDGDYPQSSTQKLSAEDVKGYDAATLRIMRNEIFARHSYVFKSEDLKSHFGEVSWYKARYADVEPKLSEIERNNIPVILAREAYLKKHGELRVLIKELPLRTLPFDYSGNLSAAVTLSGTTNSPEDVDARPDGSDNSDLPGYRGFQSKLFGLLPDTSKYYGVVWFSPGGMSVAGMLGTVTVTTLDKKFRKISSAYIARHTHIDEFGSDCGVEEKTTAVINRDLSYSCAYHADISCPGGDGAASEESTYDEVVSGRINKDGTITEERRNGENP